MNISEFIKYLFDRPVGDTEWYFCDEHEDPFVAKDILVRLAGEVFKGIAKIARLFNEKQVCMGLQYLINPSCGSISYLYLDSSIDFDLRKNAIMSMEIVFRDVFSHISAKHGLYQDTQDTILSYRRVCYMWWDMFPRHGIPRQPSMEKTDDVICQAIYSILKIDSLACQESALHGLGHWYFSRPDEIMSVVQSFLPNAPVELKRYAMDVVQGLAQ